MTKSYEELVGALGRGVFFRPERKRVRDLLSRDAEPLLVVDGEAYKLFDVSMNGLSFEVPHNDTRFVTDRELELTLSLYGESAYCGRARVVRVKPQPHASRVAVALTSGFLDLPEMIRRDEEGRLRRELSGGADEVHRLVPEKYREVIARTVHFVQYYRRSLGRHEARLRSEGHELQRVRALAETASQALRPRWEEVERAASEAALTFLHDAKALRAAKEYTESTLTQLLLGSPMHARSYLKPLGYPGDYQTMLYSYANTFEGESVFDQVFHKLCVEHPLASGIRTRKDFIVQHMSREQRRVQERGDETFRVTSLGCGPAREVVEHIDARGTAARAQSVFTLIDQEEQTLSVAYRDSQRSLAKAGVRGEVNCLNLSFGQLLSDVSFLRNMPEQDFIYSTGLFDYLREERAQALVQALYGRLAPGGLLAVGNASSPNLHFWTLEFLLDWTLLYRTKGEMSKLAARLPGDAEVSVVSEPGNAYYFLLVRRH